MPMKNIAAVIPAYNEAEAIADVVHGILALHLPGGPAIDPVVVNDCSTDHTAEMVSGMRCIVLNLPVNLGIGGAVQTGFRFAFRRGYDAAIQVDGDGQHPPEEIPALLARLESGDVDVVVGSRFLSDDGFRSSFLRRIGIRYFGFVNRLLTGIRVTDSTSGFRVLNRKALEIVSAYYPDQYPEPEAILMYAMHGLRIAEIPVRMRERLAGHSSIGVSASMYYMLKVTLTIFFSYLRLRHRRS